MSHHYSGPDFGFPRGDARLDFTDLYAFPKPGDAGKSILIMNVHPSAVVNPPGPTTAEPFAPEALYELKIDTNGDAVADIAYRVRFSSSEDGAQTATLRRVEGAQAAGTGDGGQVIVEGAPVSTGREAQVTEAGDYRFFAGWRSDPFFFDVQGALNNLQFTGDDFFADKDVCSIVLEVPNSALGPKEVGLWARTLIGAGGGWVQADRGARPSQAVFLAGEERRRLPRRGAGGRCPFRSRLRALAGARGWVYAGGSKAGGRDAAAGHPVAMTPRAQRPSRAMAGHSPTTSLMPSWPCSPTGRWTRKARGSAWPSSRGCSRSRSTLIRTQSTSPSVTSSRWRSSRRCGAARGCSSSTSRPRCSPRRGSQS